MNRRVARRTARRTSRRVNRRQELLRGAMQTTPSASPEPPAATPDSDVLDQLERLVELRTAGVLDDEEFAAAKAKLLG